MFAYFEFPWYTLILKCACGGIQMNFQGMSIEMRNMFMNWYNEQTGKKSTIYMFASMVIFFVVGGYILFTIPRDMNWIGGTIPKWFLLVFVAWFPFSFFYGAKFGVRFYHRLHRVELVRSFEHNLANNTMLDDVQKDTMRNYLIHYLTTEPKSMMKGL